jgi:uncharacterized membrane protein
MEKKRYTIPDALRGFSLVSMMLYHAVWDLVNIYGISIPWFRSNAGFVWQQSICWTFILLSGFCWHFGRKKFRRGLIVLAGAAIISVVTIVFLPSCAIRYGVLGLIAAGMLLLIPLDKLLYKVHPVIGAVVSFAVFLIAKNIPSGFIGFGNNVLAVMPAGLYKNNFTAWLGFPHDAFFSCDYFPVIPWIFLYITGYFLYHVFKKYDLLRYLSSLRIKPLEFMGRHSLIIYMLHQPVIYGALFLIFNIV